MTSQNRVRLIVEVDARLKKDFYDALQADGLTFKDWFVQQANRYLSNRGQRELKLDQET